MTPKVSHINCGMNKSNENVINYSLYQDMNLITV